VDPREHINLLVLLTEQLLQLANLPFQQTHSLLERLGVTPGKRSATELIAGLAFETDIGALCATRADAVAADLLGATSIACLCDAGLATGPNLDHFHRQYSRHDGGWRQSVGGAFCLRRWRLAVLSRWCGAHKGITGKAGHKLSASRFFGAANKTSEFVVVDFVVQTQRWRRGKAKRAVCPEGAGEFRRGAEEGTAWADVSRWRVSAKVAASGASANLWRPRRTGGCRSTPSTVGAGSATRARCFFVFAVPLYPNTRSISMRGKPACA